MASTDYGTVTDYATGEPIRPATRAEHARSLAAGETGAFRDDDDRVVYVDGGPETASTYTVEIQGTSGSAWQALAPAETIDASTLDQDLTAEDVAAFVADNQTVAEGTDWRICVWGGAEADTKTTPAYVWTPAQ